MATHSSILENSTDCIVRGVAKGQTRLSDFYFHFSLWYFMCFQRTLWFPCPHLSCYIVKVYGQLLPLNNRLHRQRHVYHVHNRITEHNDWHTVCAQNLCQINKSASFIHILPRGYSQRRPRVGCTLKFFDSKNIPYLHKEHGLIYVLSLIKFIHFQWKNIAIFCIHIQYCYSMLTFLEEKCIFMLCLMKSLFLQNANGNSCYLNFIFFQYFSIDLSFLNFNL